MKIRELCRYIEEHSEEALKLEDLARRAGLSAFHFQRSFKAAVGLTPKQYQETARLRSEEQLADDGRNGGCV